MRRVLQQHMKLSPQVMEEIEQLVQLIDTSAAPQQACPPTTSGTPSQASAFSVETSPSPPPYNQLPYNEPPQSPPHHHVSPDAKSDSAPPQSHQPSVAPPPPPKLATATSAAGVTSPSAAVPTSVGTAHVSEPGRPASCASSSAAEAERFRLAGNQLYGKGALGEAEAAYRASLELDGGVVASWSNLALVLLKQGRAGEAEQACRTALGINAPQVGPCPLVCECADLCWRCLVGWRAPCCTYCMAELSWSPKCLHERAIGLQWHCNTPHMCWICTCYL